MRLCLRNTLYSNIGFLAGSQQFTANNLQFTSCLTAIKQQWNWGFVWKNIYVLSCYVAIDCTAYSGVTNQGTSSISVVDSHFNGVPYAITLGSKGDQQPNIVLDNLLVENSQSVVLVSGGATLLAGSSGPLYFNSWVRPLAKSLFPCSTPLTLNAAGKWVPDPSWCYRP